MEFEKIIQLIDAVSQSHVTHFQIQDKDLNISIKTDREQMAPVILRQEDAKASVPCTIQEEIPKEKEPKLQGNLVKSPLVGTFYEASSPESQPFVQVGDPVKKGQVLGLVEAMKLMNEIESEFDGTVKEILVNNEQMVEYGQPLFVIQ